MPRLLLFRHEPGPIFDFSCNWYVVTMLILTSPSSSTLPRIPPTYPSDPIFDFFQHAIPFLQGLLAGENNFNRLTHTSSTGIIVQSSATSLVHIHPWHTSLPW